MTPAKLPSQNQPILILMGDENCSIWGDCVWCEWYLVSNTGSHANETTDFLSTVIKWKQQLKSDQQMASNFIQKLKRLPPNQHKT